MKIKELIKVKVPNLKPRDTRGQAVLAAKRNAGGRMTSKADKVGRAEKHKGCSMQEGLEDNQADLMREFEQLMRENASSLSSKTVKTLNDKMQAAAEAFNDAANDDDDDDAAEDALESMGEVLDELKNEIYRVWSSK